MSTYTVGPEMTFEAGGTIAQYALVKMGTDGKIVVSEGTLNNDYDVFGVAQEAAVSGDSIRVTNINVVGSFKVLAGGAITRGAIVYTGASGKATATTTSLSTVGLARDAATADGDIIEVLRVIGTNDDIA